MSTPSSSRAESDTNKGNIGPNGKPMKVDYYSQFAEEIRFPNCFYHKRAISSLCITAGCQCKYYTVCDEPECILLHAHVSANIIPIERFNRFVEEHTAALNLLKSRVKGYYEQIRHEVMHQFDKDVALTLQSLEQIHTHRVIRTIKIKDFQGIRSEDLEQFISSYEENAGSEKSQRMKMEALKQMLVKSMQDVQPNVKSLSVCKEYRALILGTLVEKESKKDYTVNQIALTTFESKVITFKDQLNAMLKMLMDNRVPAFSELKLRYRGSDSDYSALQYHQSVDGLCPTLTLIRTAKNRKFGVFLNCKITHTNDWISDVTGMSFIFSLDHNEVYKLKPEAKCRTKTAFGGTIGPQIGSGCDIYISDHCFKNQMSGSNLGGSFMLPYGLEFNTPKAQSYLAGEEKYVVIEYEVYSFDP